MAELRVERDRLAKGAYRTGLPLFRDGFVQVPHFDAKGVRVAWARYTDAEWEALPPLLVDKGLGMKAEASSVEAPKVA